jgi:hypothetical protein
MTHAPSPRNRSAVVTLLSFTVLLAGCASAVVRPTASDLSGKWETGPGFDAATLLIQKNGEDQYTVDWETEGCLGGHAGTTTAIFTSGHLRLSSPVILYSDDPVSSYAVALRRHKITLVPEASSIDSAYARLQTLRPATR